MELSAALKKYLSGTRTGQLVIRFAGEPHLCKVAVEAGEAVYISLGTKSPEETLSYIRKRDPIEMNFIDGIPPPRRCDEPLNEVLLSLRGEVIDKADVPGDFVVAGDALISGRRMERLIDDFNDLMGPLGPVLAEKVMRTFAYERGNELDGTTYPLFFKSLLDEVPEEHREEFKRRNL